MNRRPKTKVLVAMMCATATLSFVSAPAFAQDDALRGGAVQRYSALEAVRGPTSDINTVSAPESASARSTEETAPEAATETELESHPSGTARIAPATQDGQATSGGRIRRTIRWVLPD